MEISRYNNFNQDYNLLREQCIISGKLFQDELFPATNDSLYEKDSEKFKKDEKKYIIKWLRPTELYKDPKFIKNGCSTHDIIQGKCKDCWFLAAITNLTLNTELLCKVVKKDNTFETGSYAGIFHFEFWQYGEWIDVVIDDRLPTYTEDGKIKLCYARSSDEDEFWSALLEKAFAKIHGNYEALGKCGTFCEAAEDITGGVGQKFCVKHNKLCLKCRKNGIYSSINFCQLEENFKMGNFMSCFIRKKETNSTSESIAKVNNLVRKHSFSITGIVRANNGDQLIKLRNPWGHTEWNGPYSDSSDEWKQCPEIKREAAEDGEFYMTYKHFYYHFDVVEICYLKFPSTMLEIQSRERYFICIARKYLRSLPYQKILTNCFLSFEPNLAEIKISFEDFKKMINIVVLNGEAMAKIQSQGECIPICTRFNEQFDSSCKNLCRLASLEEEFFIRIYIYCQIAQNVLSLKCISAHVRIVENCIELYKAKCDLIMMDENMIQGCSKSLCHL